MRMTIYVPDDLKAEMNAAPDVQSWSALACDAFRRKLAEITTRKESRTIEDAIKRLRATKQVAEDEDVTTGRQCGQRWATTLASQPELQRLDDSWDAWMQSVKLAEDNMLFSAFFDAVAPDGEASLDAQKFWLKMMERYTDSKEVPSNAFVEGFAKGAIDFWHEVEDRV